MSSYRYDEQRMTHSIKISPAVIHFIENKTGRRVVGVERCLDADGCRFSLAGGDFVMIAAIEIECLERDFGDQGRMSRNQFEEMVMQKQDIDFPRSPSDVYPEFCDGTVRCDGTIHGAEFDMCIEDELGEAPESGADRFHRSLRKVYWHRYLKKHEQK